MTTFPICIRCHFENFFHLRLGEVERFRDVRVGKGWGLNQQSWDLGIEVTKDLRNMTKIDELIAQTDSQFDLVMIKEKMEESLVLLADLLCVPLTVVSGLSLNMRNDKAKAI